MTTMIGEVYDAFIEAGATPDKARKAAEALAGYEDRFGKIEQAITEVKGELTLVKWMLGFNTALVAAVLLKLFTT